MNKTFKDAVLFGMGLVSMSKEKIESTLDNLSKEWKENEPEGRKIVDEIIKEFDNSKKKVEDAISQKVKAAIDKINVATRTDIEKLEKRIEKLEKDAVAKNQKSE